MSASRQHRRSASRHDNRHRAAHGGAVGPRVRYLWLTVWPQSLVLYYGWSRDVALADVWPYVVFVTALFALTVVAMIRRPRLGVLADAVAAFRRAVEAQPDNPQFRANLARALGHDADGPSPPR